MIRKLLAAAIACAAPGAAFAADQPATTCELHVWPAPELKATTQGWWSNDVVNRAFDPAHGGVEPPKALVPHSQTVILKVLDLAELTGDAPANVIVHDEPLPRAAATAAERQSTSASPCYSELIVSQIFYERDPLSGRSLRTLVVHRRFGDAPAVKSSFSTWAQTKLIVFPATDPADHAAAETELIQAYRNNLLTFVAYERRPARKKRPGS